VSVTLLRINTRGAFVRRESPPIGAVGESRAVYVRDPFGYRVVIEARA
jgi:hypothetical protein